MDNEEEYHDDYMADQDPSFRAHSDITPDELTTALHSLELLKGEMYLGLQVTNLTIIDQFIMGFAVMRFASPSPAALRVHKLHQI